MRVYILFFIILLYQSNSVAENHYRDISWNTPRVTSMNISSNLEENLDEAKLFYLPNIRVLRDSSTFNFALSSWKDFKNSFINFFSHQNDSYFLYYRTPDKQPKQLDPKSSLIPFHPDNVPLKSLLKFSLLTGCDFVTKDNENYSFLYYGTKLSGYISQRLFFYGYWWAGHFSGDIDYALTSCLIDSWTQSSDDEKQVNLDNITGKITYIGKGDFWSLSVGRGKYEIGSNISGSIILNNDCNDYGYFSGKFNFKTFSISLLHASLIPDSTSSNNRNDYTDKYLVIHKIDWKPTKNFHFFIGEEVIYGNRNINPSYLLPHTLMRAVEHNLRDRDNVLIYTGVNFRPFAKNITYFNFMLDELKKSEIFKDWWGNKYAFQIGNSYTFDQEKEIILTLEFTALRPWIYTHKVLYNKFSHDRICLGFPEGSNLIQLAFEFNYGFRKNLSFNLYSSLTRQGSVGNDFSINYESRPSDTAKWLEGKITDNLKISPVITWQPLAHHKLKFGMNISQTDDNDPEKELIISFQAIY